MNGLRNGFVIEGEFADLTKTARNLPTNKVEKIKITQWLIKLLKKGMLYGPFLRGRIPEGLFAAPVHRSPLGGIQRREKYRPFVHFSYPRWGRSVNSSTDPEWSTVSYLRFKQIVAMIASMGKGAWVWIADAADAFLQLTIQHKQHHLMGIEWERRTMVFSVMMWGLSCAPRMYTLFADGIEEIITQSDTALFYNGLRKWCAHYLDDFFGGHTRRREAFRQFKRVIEVFERLNIPYKQEKIVSPSQAQRVLGWIFDTDREEIRVPREKAQEMLDDIDAILATLRRRAKPTRKALRSIAGKLRWASAAVFGGQAFVRRIERAANRPIQNHQHVNVSAAVKHDFLFWKRVLPEISRGVPFAFILRAPDSGTLKVCTDAAGTVPNGVGGASTSGFFFALPWATIWPTAHSVDIYLGEMLAVAVFVIMCGHTWRGQCVSIFTDNECVEWALRKKSCAEKRKDISAILKLIVEEAHRNRFYFWVNRITTKENVIADDLSRMKWPVRPTQDPKFGHYPLDRRLDPIAVANVIRRLTSSHSQYIHHKH
jgi:hypothetical protein